MFLYIKPQVTMFISFPSWKSTSGSNLSCWSSGSQNTMDVMKENSPPEEGIESHPRPFKGLQGCFHKWRFGNVRVWSMSVDGLRRHGWAWVCASASQHDTNGKVGFSVAIICNEEWNDGFNPDLNWPGTSDAWWHFFLPCSMANVLWLRRTERCHEMSYLSVLPCR